MEPVSGFVALLDVLGFSSMVGGPASRQELERYLETVRAAITGKREEKGVQFILFSDTIVITTRVADDLSLRVLLRACSRTFGLLLENRIAVRGAIAHGQFFREDTDNGAFVAGRPIVEAYDFEKRQDWIGIMVCPSVLTAIPNLDRLCTPPKSGASRGTVATRLPWLLMAQRCKQIPFHPDGKPGHAHIYDGLAIIPSPVGGDPTRSPAYIGSCIEGLKTLRLLVPDPRAQAKYAAAIRWLRQRQNQLRDFLVDATLPNSFRWY